MPGLFQHVSFCVNSLFLQAASVNGSNANMFRLELIYILNFIYLLFIELFKSLGIG